MKKFQKENQSIEFFANDQTFTNELLGQFIDVVEDFLDDRNVQLESERTLPTREDSCCCPEGVIIHGDNYDHLHDLFFDILNNWSSSDEDSGVDFFIVDGILTSDRRLLKYATTDSIEAAHISKIGTVIWNIEGLTVNDRKTVLNTAKLVRHRFEEKLSELSEIERCTELLLAVGEVLPKEEQTIEEEAFSRINCNGDQNADDFLRERLFKALDVHMLTEWTQLVSNWYSNSFYLKCQDEKTAYSVIEKIEEQLPKGFNIFDVGRFSYLEHTFNSRKVETHLGYITDITVCDSNTIRIGVEGDYDAISTMLLLDEFLEKKFPETNIEIAICHKASATAALRKS